MQELIDRIEQIERSRQRWKVTALVLGALLLSVLTTGVGFYAVEQVRHRRAEALRQEAEAQRRFEFAVQLFR